MKNRKFAFLIHPRDSEDMFKVSKVFRQMTLDKIEETIKCIPPVIRGKITDSEGKHIGWMIVIPLTAQQMLERENLHLAKTRIIQAIEKAKEMECRLTGLGMFTSSLTGGGKKLIGKIAGMGITNGNSLTAAVTVLGVEKLISLLGKELDNIAIVGVGSVGFAVAQILAERKLSLLLIGRSEKKLQNQRDFLLRSARAEIQISTNIRDISIRDIIIVTTSANGTIIHPEYLAPGAIVYDDTQPKNTSSSVIKERPDVLVIDGALVSTPNFDWGMDIGLKPGIAYACLAETLLLHLEGRYENYSVGEVTALQAREMSNLMEKHGLELAPFQSFGRLLDNHMLGQYLNASESGVIDEKRLFIM